ncbi:MAG: putative lipid II flippase MurJ [Holosporales bacterium]
MKMIKSALNIALFTIISRVTGYFRDILMAKFIGANVVMDALVIAIKVPSILRRIFAEGAMNSSFIPIFSGLILESREKAQNFLKDILSIMVSVLLVIIVLFEIFMPNLFHFILPAHKNELMSLATFFSRITFPFILLISLTALFSGVLNSLEKFSAAASSQIGGNCFIILIMLLADPKNMAQGADVAIAITGSGLVQLIWVLIPCYLCGIKPGFKKITLSPSVKNFLKRMLPAAFGAGVLQLNLLVDMYIAALLPGGTNSYLYYADRLYQLPISVTGTAMGTVLLPLLTRLWREDKQKEAQYTQNRAIEFTILITLPALACLYFLSEPLIRLSFERGEFTSAATSAVTSTVLGFMIGLPAYILAKIFNSSFFARQNTLIPTVVAIAAMGVNIVFNVMLMDQYQHVGIAIATSIASWFNVIVLCFILIRRKEFSLDAALVKFFGKSILSIVISISVFLLSAGFFNKLLTADHFLTAAMGLTGSFLVITGVYFSFMGLFKALRFKDYLGE